MKKICLTLMALVAVLAVNAQIYGYSSTSVNFEKVKSDSNTTFFVRAGLSTMSAEVDGEGADNKLGYDINFGFQKPFTNLGFYWGMEFGLDSRGFDLDINSYPYQYGYCENVTYMGHSFSFSPATLGYKYDINVLGGLTLDAHLGVFMSYSYVQTIECDCGEVDDDKVFGGADSFDYGCKVGLGVWWKNFNLDCSYKRGFNDVNNFDGDMADFNSLTLSVGYAF